MPTSRSEAIGQEVAARPGVVTAMHPTAAAVGADILTSGGTAHDAAVAILAAMSVVEPFMSGLGGHGAAIVADPGRKPYVIDASAVGPARAGHGPRPMRGAGAVPVPTALTGWTGLHAAGASRTLEELLRPAVRAARDGEPVAWYTALMIAAHGRLLRDDPAAAAVFLPHDGLPPQAEPSQRSPADRFVQSDLAATLERVASNGLDELRSGETGRAICDLMARAGGAVAPDDLARLIPAEPDPVPTAPFRGFDVFAGPPASAGPSLLEMLSILGDLDPDETPLGSARYYARIADAQRAAFLDREQHGDPRFVDAPLPAYGDPELARLRRDDLDAARGGPLPRRDLHAAGYPVDAPAAAPPEAGSDTSTTHVNEAAPDGTMISATFTLGYPFGSGVMAPGTGLLLGNTLHQFADGPPHPNQVAPGKRAVWNGAPTILLRDGRPTIAVGAPGGPRIPGAIAQVLIAHLAYGLSPQRATEVPRIFQKDDVAYLDDRAPAAVFDELRAQGRDVRAVREGPFTSNFARPSLIVRDASDAFVGGVDAWRLGTVATT